MKTIFARAVACLSLMLATNLAASGVVNSPPVVAVDGTGAGSFSDTGSLNYARNNHTATLLANGEVLATGGYEGSNYLRSAELYVPDWGEWWETGSMATPRYSHTATLLADGRVLVAGGHGSSEPLASAEIYDPVTGEWTDTGSMKKARYQHTATLLPNGKVLVAGGYNYLDGDALNSAELYDPATGEWSYTGSLTDSRYIHTATLLGDGKVLVAGGVSEDYVGSAEIYDPATGGWMDTGGLTEARYLHTATLLADGKVLVTGGYGENFYLNSSEIYDPETGDWSGTGDLAEARYSHAAALLGNGKVLVCGGYSNDGVLGSAELFDPVTGEWADIDGLGTARYIHTSTVLANGAVLVAAGSGDGSLSSAELFSPPEEIAPTDEGSEGSRSGTFSDEEGNATVTLSASIGTVTADNDAGTWYWTMTPTDGPSSTVVTITATDGESATAVASFTFKVANVAPWTTVTAPDEADEDAPVAISFSAEDPGTEDQAAGFAWTINYDDGVIETIPAGTASPLERTHTFAESGWYGIGVIATDKDGGEREETIHWIYINDLTGPVIETHADVGPIEATGPDGAVVEYADAVVTDNSGEPVTDITYSKDSGEVFPLGFTTVTITATDGSGNPSTSTFKVNVVDTTPPNAFAPPGGFSPLTLATGLLPDYTAQLVASDLVGVVHVTQTPSPGSAVGGTVSVSLVAEDAAGNPSLPVVFEVTAPIVGLVNGSFEDGYNGWTVTGNQYIQSEAPYAATDGVKLVSFNAGNQAPGGTLSQTFTTLPGEIYQLSFDVGTIAYNSSSQILGVEVTGSSAILSQSFTVSPLVRPIQWQSRSLRFTANSSSTTVLFRDLSQATISVDLLLDHVAIIPLVTRTLTIASSPDVGAEITVSPPDNNAQANGISNFTRRYLDGSIVNLTAPPANNGFRFQKWLKNGVLLSTEKVVSIVMDANLTLTAVYVDSPPIITTQPVGGAVALGGSKTLSVVAEGTGTLAYQWRLNEAEIDGAHSASYAIANMRPEDVGNYDVIVSNAIGPVTSDPAAVTLVTNTLVNGSFEQGYTGWSFSGSQSIQESAPYVATDGVRLVAFNGTNQTPNGVLEQIFATTPGRTYTLSFDAGVLAYNTSPQTLGVNVTGTGSLLSRTVTIPGTLSQAVRWLPQSFIFVANSPTSTLSFRDQSATTNNIDLLLDHVSITEGAVVPNTAPVAADDHYVTTLNTALVIPAPGVLANDNDPDSGPITAVLAAAPAHGTLALNADGSFTYTPENGRTGMESFTYRANDGALNSNLATVRLDVNPPSAELLFNGGFESGFTGWITSGNQFIQSAAPYVPTEGAKLASFNAGDRSPNAVLSQSFATMAGQTYTLAFDLGALSYNTNSQTMQVTVAGASTVLSRTITITGPGGGNNRWLPQSFTFVADSSVSTLTFRDQSATTNAIDLMLDHVRVTGAAALAAAPRPQDPAIVQESVVPDISTPPSGEMRTPSLSGTPGDFTIRMTASVAGNYVLERSGDLAIWEVVGEKSVSEPGFIEFRDTEAPAERQQFYRVGRNVTSP